MGDLVDAIEAVAGHLVTTHLHDNRRKSDDHLVPFEGAIDWAEADDDAAEGGLRRRLDVRAGRDPTRRGACSSGRSRRGAGSNVSRRCDDVAYIQDIAKHEGEQVTIHGWLYNRRSSGKIHFLQVRDGSGFIQAVMSKAAVGDEAFTQADHLSQETSLSVTGTVRADARARGGFEIDVVRLEVHHEAHDFPITPKEHGVDYLLDRRHLWIRTPRQQAILRVRHEVINAVRDFFNAARLHPVRHADLHAGGLRGHDEPVPGPVLRGHDRVPHAERAAVQRGQRDGARPRVLLRADVPRREVEDAPPPHRVLDGRARDGVRHARRRHRRWPRAWSNTSWAAPSTRAPAELKVLERDTSKLARRQGAVPAAVVRRGRGSCWSTRACPSSTAPTSAAPTKRCSRISTTGRSACTATRPR